MKTMTPAFVALAFTLASLVAVTSPAVSIQTAPVHFTADQSYD